MWPLPHIDDILASLGNAKYYSSLDLKSGYWQVAMSDEDKGKTTFTCHRGLFEFNVMPFGLTNAPSVFQQLIGIVLEGINGDIIIFSETFEDHKRHINEVFDRLRNANLKLKLSKCDFLKTEFILPWTHYKQTRH